jgi:hypothetical protein
MGRDAWKELVLGIVVLSVEKGSGKVLATAVCDVSL